MHLKAFFIFVVYIVVGCVFYRVVEEKSCESEEALSAPGFDEENCVESWTIIDALYFSMVTMSTVGYGDLTPSSYGSKVFTCFYIIVGVAVVFVKVSEALGGVLGGINDLFLRFLARFDHKHDRSISGDGVGISGELIDLDGDGQVDFAAPPHGKIFWAQGLGPGIVVLSLIQFISALTFMQLEPDLLFGDAMYHCFVTATTVGYGDVSLTTQGSRLWAFFHIASCVSFLGAFIGRVGQLQTERMAQLQRYEMLLRGADKELICSLDQDGNGLDRLEFVFGMLMKLGAQLCGSPLKWSDVEPFIQRFDAMDVDKSGHLTHDDIEQMASAIAEKQNFKPSGPSSTPETKATEDTDEQSDTFDPKDATKLHNSTSVETNSHYHVSSPESLGTPAQMVFETKIKELEALVLERDLRIQSLQSELETARSTCFLGSTSRTLPGPPKALVTDTPKKIVVSI